MDWTVESLARSVLEEKSSSKLNFYPELIDQIYYNEFPEYDVEEINDKQKSILPISIYAYEYETNLNKHGFRSPKFINNVDFLIAGCSVTFGDGLPIEKIWHKLLLDNTNYTYNSVAWSGDSINGQIQKIFCYINTYGLPKNILMFIPDFNRIAFFNNKKLILTNTIFRHKEYIPEFNKYFNISNKYSNIAFYGQDQNFKRKIKRPFNASDVIPEEVFHFYSAQSLNFLEMYCSSMGINLIYSSWDSLTCSVIQKISNKKYFTSFVPFNHNEWIFDKKKKFWVTKNKTCHAHFFNDENFETASDIEYVGPTNAHPGLHRHLHIRNTFAKALNEKFNYDFVLE